MESIDSGLAAAVNDNDEQVPAGLPAEQVEPQEGRSSRPWAPLNGYVVVDLSSRDRRCLLHQAARRRRRRRSSKSSRPRVIRCAAGRRRAPTSQPGDDGALFSFLACSKHSVVADPPMPTSTTSTRCSPAPTRSCGRAARPSPNMCVLTPAGDPVRAPAPDRHGDHAVRAGRAVAGPSRNGVHAAGVVGRDRRPRPRFGRPRTGLRRRPGRRVPGRCVRQRARRWPRGCAVARELVDLSMLETQILGLTYYPVTYFEMLGRPWRDASAADGARDRPRRRTGWSTSAAAPLSSGSTCAR